MPPPILKFSTDELPSVEYPNKCFAHMCKSNELDMRLAALETQMSATSTSIDLLHTKFDVMFRLLNKNFSC